MVEGGNVRIDPSKRQDQPLAIICGGGSLPFAVADAAIKRGRRAILFALKGWAEPVAVARYEHHWMALGQLGRLFRLMNEAGCRDVVFIGTLVRPAIREIRLDWQTLRLLPRALARFRGGDDGLISGMADIFEDHGFRIVGPQEIAPDILMPAGPLGRLRPSPRDVSDIARGLDLLKAMGPFDVGQAVVVADNHVLAVEAADGTDEMLAHVAQMRLRRRIRSPQGVGVLVKAPKPQQDHRFDLPSTGPETVEAAARAGLAGVALVAGGTVIAEPQRVAELADASGLFIVGTGAGG